MVEFQKIPFEQFLKQSKEYGFVDELTPDEMVKAVWQAIKMPIPQGIKPSMAYKIFLPYSFYLEESCSVEVPTGITAKILNDDFYFAVFIPNSRRSIHCLSIVKVNNMQNSIVVKIKTRKRIFLKQGEYFLLLSLEPKSIRRTYIDKERNVWTSTNA